MRRAPMHVNSANGFVFISHLGDVFPSGYLPLIAGNVRQTPLDEIYRTSPLFGALRDKSQLKGRCGACEYQVGLRRLALAGLRHDRRRDGRRAVLRLPARQSFH